MPKDEMMEIKALKISVAFGLTLCIASLGLKLWQGRNVAVELQDYGPAPAFRLTSQLGQPYDSASLKDKVWVASFVYTTCKESCPMLGAQMKRLSSGMPDSPDFRMLSFSVDPEKDTPQVLAKYAKDLGVEDPRWSFLTGAKKQIADLVVKGFKLAAVHEKSGSAADVLHSSKLVLVDKQGHIRGYFDGLLGETAPEIQRAAVQLLKQP
jgi:protein SCO1/2